MWIIDKISNWAMDTNDFGIIKDEKRINGEMTTVGYHITFCVPKLYETTNTTSFDIIIKIFNEITTAIKDGKSFYEIPTRYFDENYSQENIQKLKIVNEKRNDTYGLDIVTEINSVNAYFNLPDQNCYAKYSVKFINMCDFDASLLTYGIEELKSWAKKTQENVAKINAIKDVLC